MVPKSDHLANPRFDKKPSAQTVGDASGQGAFAVSDIQQGQVIIEEKPVFEVDRDRIGVY